jgi:hypothetical protein
LSKATSIVNIMSYSSLKILNNNNNILFMILRMKLFIQSEASQDVVNSFFIGHRKPFPNMVSGTHTHILINSSLII